MIQTLFDLRGKTALVTGSSRGLGLTLALGLGKAGASVVLNGRDSDRLKRAVSELKSQGLTVSGYTFDITNKADVTEKIHRIEKEVGALDILVNNAGVQKRAPLEEFDETGWRDIIETNLTGVFLTTQAVVKSMISRKAGKIINICSLMSELGRPTIGPYAASKGGLKMLTKSMALEWARHNIQVNGLGPGYFITEMTQPLADDAKFDSWLKARTPANRWGLPEELIGPLVFLASEASSFVAGQILYVDGGILTAI